MTENTNPRAERAERSAPLVDEPTDVADRQDRDRVSERVADRDDDGAVDSVLTETDQAEQVDADADLRDDDLRDDRDVDRTLSAKHAADADDVALDPADDRTEMMPGDVGTEPAGTSWTEGTATGLRDRWQDLQLRFVDDPRGVLSEAQSLVAEAVQGQVTALTRQQAELDTWASGGNGDTEQLRVALQRYRDFFDRMLVDERS